ncbi:MAG: PilC/PilY family type IV pilus protein [Pseudomonadota bacterium]|nr:PilC/PilY family type IV pilus protein [Pseudomonadota bacterium]
MLYRLLSQRIKALTLLVSSLCTLIVAADELDYIWFSPDAAQNINILFVLDASSSLVESYKLKFSLVDPYLNPSDPNAAALLATKNAIESKLVNTAVVPMTLTESHDSWHCPVDVELYAEGYYADCPVPYMERWFLQRIDVARTVISDVLPALVGTNVGFMRTGLNNKSFWRWYADGGPTGINIRTAYPDAGQTNNGAYVIQAMKPIETNEDASEIALRLDQTYVENILDANQTPLTESLFEAFYYLTGQKSIWSKKAAFGWPDEHLDDIDTSAYKNENLNLNYKENITECSSNHIVMVTDGQPTYDWHANSEIQALTGGSVSMPSYSDSYPERDRLPEHTLLDELSGYLATHDVMPDLNGEQLITTHFISTWSESEARTILDEAALASGGFHKALDDVADLHEALQELLADIKNMSKPAIGYNVLTASSSGHPINTTDEAFVNIWEMKAGHWFGNLKKFKVNEKGELVGKNNQPFLSDDGSVNPNTTSLWSGEVDGHSPTKGGALDHLSSFGSNRFSIPQSQLIKNTTINQTTYVLDADNALFTNADLAVETDQDRKHLLKWAGGMDIYDIDDDKISEETRQSLGDQLNQKPYVISYFNGSKAHPVVFTGSNEGYLHAFDSSDGEHLYSFMPFEFLKNIQYMDSSNQTKHYGLDGALYSHDINSQSGSAKTMLYFGLGRGGSSFYALDVTERTQPKYAWSINNESPGFNRLGLSVSQAAVGTIKRSENDTQDIVVLGGGLDPNMPYSSEQQLGNALYIMDAATGDLLWSISNEFADINIPEMKYSLVSKPILIDANHDGFIDTFFINDIRGQVFRCDIVRTALKILDCGRLGVAQYENEDLVFTNNIDVSISSGLGGHSRYQFIIALSSGNRFNPLDIEEQNRLVVFIDDFIYQPPEGYQYTNAGSIFPNDLTSVGGVLDKGGHRGWLFQMPHIGEKSFAQTLIFNDQIFMSTLTPPVNSVNPCEPVHFGTASLYGFSLKDGEALSNDQDSYLLWSDEARGLPGSPDMITRAASATLQNSINIGVDQTNIDLDDIVLFRTYWYQSR